MKKTKERDYEAEIRNALEASQAETEKLTKEKTDHLNSRENLRAELSRICTAGTSEEYHRIKDQIRYEDDTIELLELKIRKANTLPFLDPDTAKEIETGIMTQLRAEDAADKKKLLELMAEIVRIGEEAGERVRKGNDLLQILTRDIQKQSVYQAPSFDNFDIASYVTEEKGKLTNYRTLSAWTGKEG